MIEGSKTDQIFVGEYVGPVKSRQCTDILFLLLFLAMLFAMNIIGLTSIGVIPSNYISKGEPMRLIRGVDYTGEICGTGGIVGSLENKWEPNALGFTPDSYGNLVSPGIGICVSSCPLVGEVREDPYGMYGSWTATVSTTNVLGYCLPITSKRIDNFLKSSFADFIIAAKVIGSLGFVFAIAFSLLFLATIRVPGVLRSVIWLSITTMCVMLFGGGYILLHKVNEQQKLEGASAPSQLQMQLQKAVGAMLVLLGVIWVSMICVMREKVALAITLVRESVKAILALPLLIFFPVLESLLFGLITLLWALYSVYLLSSGAVETKTDEISGDSYKIVSYNENTVFAILFLIFGWVWIGAFVEAVGQLISSHAVLVWYFSPNRRLVSSMQVFSSAGLCLRYHCGTAAFGSLLIAIVQTIRMMLEYIQHKLQVRKSCLARFVFCLLSCVLCCFERCLKFVCDTAFVQCAMFGTSFCVSSFRGMSLISRSLGKVSSVTAVVVFVVIIGKLSVALTAGLISYLYLSTYMPEKLHGPVATSILVGYLAFQTASLFLNVVATTSNTILQGFLMEEEMPGAILMKENVSNVDEANSESVAQRKCELRKLVNEMKEDDLEEQVNFNVFVHKAGESDLIEIEMAVRTNTDSINDKLDDHKLPQLDKANVKPDKGESICVAHGLQHPQHAKSSVIRNPSFDTSTSTLLPKRSWDWDAPAATDAELHRHVNSISESDHRTSMFNQKEKKNSRKFDWDS